MIQFPLVLNSSQTDSGGPLVTLKDGLWWLVGDSVWGGRCTQRNMIGIYGNVTYFLDWIHHQMRVTTQARFSDCFLIQLVGTLSRGVVCVHEEVKRRKTSCFSVQCELRFNRLFKCFAQSLAETPQSLDNQVVVSGEDTHLCFTAFFHPYVSRHRAVYSAAGQSE